MALQQCSKIGLRTPRDSISPFVRDMYVQDLGNIVDAYARSDVKVFATSEILRAETDALCQKYGDAIWPSDPVRPWLLEVGGGDKKAPYSKKLYWADLQDKEFIKSTVFQLAVARTKKRRCKLRSSLPPPSVPRSVDGTWTPSRPTRFSHRHSSALESSHECFGRLNNGYMSHSIADKLRESGVWLGCAEDDEVAISGEPHRTVAQRLLRDTISGATQDPSFLEMPYVFDHVPATTTVKVACAGCGATAFNEAEENNALTVECEMMNIDKEDWIDPDERPETNAVNHEEEDGVRLDTNSWFFNVRLGSNKVFAFLKPERRGADQYWHFWQVEGGYGSRFCLKTIPVQSSKMPPPAPPGSAPERRTTARSPVILQKRPRASSASAEYVPPERSSSDTTAASDRHRASQGNGRAADEQEVQRLLSAHGSDDDEEPSAKRQRRESSCNSLYRLTPGVQQQRAGFQAINRSREPANYVGNGSSSAQTKAADSTIGSAFTADLDRARRNASPAGNEGTPSMSAPTYKHRFLVWLYVGWASGRNAVYLDDTMSVHRVFELFRDKLKRQLNGRNLGAVAIGVPGLDEEKVNLELDDKDGWEALQEIAIGAGEKVLYGNVIVDTDQG